MAESTWPLALSRLLAHEGGYINHPRDPGGPTKYGITLATYRRTRKRLATARDIKALSTAEAGSIYHQYFWQALRCDALPSGLDYALFDYGVSSGVSRAGKVLRRVLGLSDAYGQVSETVLAAIAKRGPAALIKALCTERLAFLKRLATWPVFGHGWQRRVSQVKATALKLAAGKAARPRRGRPPVATPGKGEVPQDKTTRDVLTKGVPGGGAVSLAAFRDWVAAHPFETAVIAALLIACIAGAMALLKRRRQHAQDAPTPKTPLVPEMNSGKRRAPQKIPPKIKQQDKGQ